MGEYFIVRCNLFQTQAHGIHNTYVLTYAYALRLRANKLLFQHLRDKKTDKERKQVKISVFQCEAHQLIVTSTSSTSFSLSPLFPHLPLSSPSFPHNSANSPFLPSTFNLTKANVNQRERSEEKNPTNVGDVWNNLSLPLDWLSCLGVCAALIMPGR